MEMMLTCIFREREREREGVGIGGREKRCKLFRLEFPS